MEVIQVLFQCLIFSYEFLGSKAASGQSGDFSSTPGLNATTGRILATELIFAPLLIANADKGVDLDTYHHPRIEVPTS